MIKKDENYELKKMVKISGKTTQKFFHPKKISVIYQWQNLKNYLIKRTPKIFRIKIRNISSTKKISRKVERKNVKILESKNY